MFELPFPTTPSRWFRPDRRKGEVTIPKEWEIDGRRFLTFGGLMECDTCDGTGDLGEGYADGYVDSTCWSCTGLRKLRRVTERARPQTEDELAAVASDLEGIWAAERLAAEIERRLDAWPQTHTRASGPRCIIWHTKPLVRDAYGWGGWNRGISEIFSSELEAAANITSQRDYEVEALARVKEADVNPILHIEDDHGHSGVYRMIAHLLIAGAHYRDARAAGTVTVPDPFAPIGELLDLGYVFNGWSATHISLVMPPFTP